jgi:nitrogen fixation protein NifB
MSTNGLLLPERIDDVVDAGIGTLTVTVNAVDPDILLRINGGIYYKGELDKERSGAERLIANQLEGIGLAAAAGIIVKVNSVLVPDINGAHIEEIARAVGEKGAHIYNIIPLIPSHLLAEERKPDCDEIDAARVGAERHVPVFRHCMHCRADAVGLLGGEDHGKRIYQNRVADTFSHG